MFKKLVCQWVKMGILGCPGMSVSSYQFMSCNIPQEWRQNLHCGESL